MDTANKTLYENSPCAAMQESGLISKNMELLSSVPMSANECSTTLMNPRPTLYSQDDYGIDMDQTMTNRFAVFSWH
jgi:hypothetical protein